MSKAASWLSVALTALLFLGTFAYAIAYLAVATGTDSTETWWWFVPVYGSIRIFGESLWLGVFHVGMLPLVWVTGFFMEGH